VFTNGMAAIKKLTAIDKDNKRRKILKSDTEIGIRLSASTTKFEYYSMILLISYLLLSCIYLFINGAMSTNELLIFLVFIILLIGVTILFLIKLKIVYLEKDMLFVKGFRDQFDLNIQKIVKIKQFNVHLSMYISIDYMWQDKKKTFWIRQRNIYSRRKGKNVFQLLNEAIINYKK
jgi:hypothetical protein